MIARALRYSLLAATLLAGCAQLPPTPEEIQAKKFEPVPGKAVIYVFRDSLEHSSRPGQISLGNIVLKTYPGTFFNWVVEPGSHPIAGFGPDAGNITVKAAAGQLYFVRQQMSPLVQMPSSFFALVDEARGRAAVLQAVRLVPEP
jgi:hypothetical protein